MLVRVLVLLDKGIVGTVVVVGKDIVVVEGMDTVVESMDTVVEGTDIVGIEGTVVVDTAGNNKIVVVAVVGNKMVYDDIFYHTCLQHREHVEGGKVVEYKVFVP